MLPSLHSLALFLAAGLALNLTPGPDMLYVAARGAGQGCSAGVASALGIGVGTLVHVALVAAGLATVLTAVPVAYVGIRLAGAAYLIYLGVRALTFAAAPSDVALAPTSLMSIFRQGVITNVLNPKVALFFLAFLPQFVDAGRGNTALQVVFLGLLFDVSGTLVNLAVAVISSHAGNRIRGRGTVMQRITGAVFIGLGLRLAWSVRA